eukprot:4409315-Amphidinium_carterae.1
MSAQRHLMAGVPGTSCHHALNRNTFCDVTLREMLSFASIGTTATSLNGSEIWDKLTNVDSARNVLHCCQAVPKPAKKCLLATASAH